MFILLKEVLICLIISISTLIIIQFFITKMDRLSIKNLVKFFVLLSVIGSITQYINISGLRVFLLFLTTTVLVKLFYKKTIVASLIIIVITYLIISIGELISSFYFNRIYGF